MTAIAATMGFYSVVAGLVMAIPSRRAMRRGVNAYERKLNEQAAAWNKIHDTAFWATFGFAAVALALTVL